MAKTTRSEKTGEAFVSYQKATDQAINERNRQPDVDGQGVAQRNAQNRDRDVDGSRKKTGGGKQKH
jgi:hypothetical protein